ncbi:HEPN domain-containing protein [Microbacterium profundi]
MLLRWEQGRGVVDELIDKRHLERVPANGEHAAQLLEQARRHATSAATIRNSDPELAFAAAYDAARKALTAILAIQGLRPTSAGGHLAVYHSALAQLDPPMGKAIKPFDWMRRTRNDTEYPHAGSAAIHLDDVDDAITTADEIVKLADTLIETLPPYGR